jgi:hypothetical protein
LSPRGLLFRSYKPRRFITISKTLDLNVLLPLLGRAESVIEWQVAKPLLALPRRTSETDYVRFQARSGCKGKWPKLTLSGRVLVQAPAPHM